MNKPMFSESWHRIAASRARLRPHVEVSRQNFRGQIWFVLRDPFTNQFFRLRAAAYQFVARLNKNKTIDEVWRESLDMDPEDAPGQEEVIRLLAQLTQANLLSSDLPADSAMLFERYKQTRQRDLRQKWLNFLFLKVPIFDPDPFLSRVLPWIRFLLGRWGVVIWSMAFLWALVLVGENWEALSLQSQGLLAPGNWFWMYVCGLGVKLWHEFGHAILCKRFGGEVRIFGVMLLVFTPLPYVDVSSSWGFRRHGTRMTVAAGGMIFEVFLAAIATMIWAATGSGTINALAFNVMVLASVTTVLFNANPLLRFDGYYIFSDLLQLPNLAQRAEQQLRYVLERYGFGSIHATSPQVSRGEGRWLTLYGVCSGLYRVLLICVVVFVVAQHFFGIGLVLAIFSISVWMLLPIGKFIYYLIRNPALERVRSKAIRLCVGIATGVVIFVTLVPLPRHFRAVGVVEASLHRQVIPNIAGYVAEVLVPSGLNVKAGQDLLRLEDPELPLRLKAAREQLIQVEAKRQFATTEAHVAMVSVLAEEQAVRSLVHSLEQQQRDLLIKAPYDGLWVCPNAVELPGTWVQRGTNLGEVVDPSTFGFTAVVSQEAASDLFGAPIRNIEVRLPGQSQIALEVGSPRMIPGKQEILPSASLGWKGGGPIEVQNEGDGTRAAEPFFLVFAPFVGEKQAALYQHRTGIMRFTLAPEPAFFQAWRSLRQLLQRRLQI